MSFSPTLLYGILPTTTTLYLQHEKSKNGYVVFANSTTFSWSPTNYISYMRKVGLEKVIHSPQLHYIPYMRKVRLLNLGRKFTTSRGNLQTSDNLPVCVYTIHKCIVLLQGLCTIGSDKSLSRYRPISFQICYKRQSQHCKPILFLLFGKWHLTLPFSKATCAIV